MGKPTICIGENKGADQLRGNREADQRLCFRYTYSRIPLLFKLGMSFGVRFKVRTFGNKHPDGSNVRIFSDQVIILHVHLVIYMCVNRVLP